MAGEWMSSHHRPINVVSHVFEEGGAVAILEPLEDFANSVRCNGHLYFSSFLRAVRGSVGSIRPSRISMLRWTSRP